MAADPILTLKGEDGAARTVTAAEIKAMPHVSASITHEGKATPFEGPLLSDVLKRVGAPLGDKMRGKALADVVVVSAADGYTVALALSDLEPGVRPTKVILADASNGAPLGGDGPFRLVVDGDLKPARSERNVVAIAVRRLAP